MDVLNKTEAKGIEMFRNRTGVLLNRPFGFHFPHLPFSMLAAAMYTMVVGLRSVYQCDVLQE